MTLGQAENIVELAVIIYTVLLVPVQLWHIVCTIRHNHFLITMYVGKHLESMLKIYCKTFSHNLTNRDPSSIECSYIFKAIKKVVVKVMLLPAIINPS